MGTTYHKFSGTNVGDEEIDLVAPVGALPSSCLYPVAGFGVAGGGFYLHAQESVSAVEDEVVGLAISPGFGNGEPQALPRKMASETSPLGLNSQWIRESEFL